MNRKTLMTFGAVGLLALIIVFQNIRFGSDIPKLKQWAEPADEMEIVSKDYSLHIYMKDGGWVINDQAFPADENSIGSLEMKVRDIKITDMVSEEGFYDRYDLSGDRAVTVTVKKSGAVLRTLVIGKPGAKSNHSFVKLDDRKAIYLAAGIQRDEFLPEIDALRNKIIFDLKGKDVESFTITSGGRTYSFYKKNEAPGKDEKEPKKGISWYCKGYDDKPLNDSTISNMLYVFSPLRSVTFPEGKTEKDLGKLTSTIVLKSGGVDYDVKIYSGKDKDYYYAVSSKNQYIFTMGTWQTEKLEIKNINDLVKK